MVVVWFLMLLLPGCLSQVLSIEQSNHSTPCSNDLRDARDHVIFVGKVNTSVYDRLDRNDDVIFEIAQTQSLIFKPVCSVRVQDVCGVIKTSMCYWLCDPLVHGLRPVIFNMTARTSLSKAVLHMIWQNKKLGQPNESNWGQLPVIRGQPVYQVRLNGDVVATSASKECIFSYKAGRVMTLCFCCTDVAQPCWVKISADVVGGRKEDVVQAKTCAQFNFTARQDQTRLTLNLSYAWCSRDIFTPSCQCYGGLDVEPEEEMAIHGPEMGSIIAGWIIMLGVIIYLICVDLRNKRFI